MRTVQRGWGCFGLWEVCPPELISPLYMYGRRLHAQRRVRDWPVSTVRHSKRFCRPIVKFTCVYGTVPGRTWCCSLAWLIVCVMIIMVKVQVPKGSE